MRRLKILGIVILLVSFLACALSAYLLLTWTLDPNAYDPEKLESSMYRLIEPAMKVYVSNHAGNFPNTMRELIYDEYVSETVGLHRYGDYNILLRMGPMPFPRIARGRYVIVPGSVRTEAGEPFHILVYPLYPPGLLRPQDPVRRLYSDLVPRGHNDYSEALRLAEEANRARDFLVDLPEIGAFFKEVLLPSFKASVEDTVSRGRPLRFEYRFGYDQALHDRIYGPYYEKQRQRSGPARLKARVHIVFVPQGQLRLPDGTQDIWVFPYFEPGQVDDDISVPVIAEDLEIHHVNYGELIRAAETSFQRPADSQPAN